MYLSEVKLCVAYLMARRDSRFDGIKKNPIGVTGNGHTCLIDPEAPPPPSISQRGKIFLLFSNVARNRTARLLFRWRTDRRPRRIPALNWRRNEILSLFAVNF